MMTVDQNETNATETETSGDSINTRDCPAAAAADGVETTPS